MRFKKDIKL